MGTRPEVQAYLDLSREYLASSRRSFDAGEVAPAHFLLLHALELAIKAALAARLGEVPKTHNVGGLFGKLYLDAVGPDVTRKVNRLLMDYDGPRYPDWESPAPKEMQAHLAFVERFVAKTVPSLLEDAG